MPDPDKIIIIQPGTNNLYYKELSATDKLASPPGTAIIPLVFWEKLKKSMRKSADGSKTDAEMSTEFDARLLQALGASDKRDKEMI